MDMTAFDKLASKTWGNDDIIDLTESFSDEAVAVQKPVPESYKKVLRDHLSRHPDDTQFILSTDDASNPHGSVICIEDSCYADVILGPDGTSADGGRSRGFGSLDRYGDHCKEPDHVAGRAARVAKSGPSRVAAPPAPAAKAKPEPPSAPSSSSAAAGPSQPKLKSLAPAPAPVKMHEYFNTFNKGKVAKRDRSSSPEPFDPPPRRKADSSSAPRKRQFVELSDSDDLLDTAAQKKVDKLLLDKRRPASEPEQKPRKKVRPEPPALAAGMGKDRALPDSAASSSPAPLLKSKPEVNGAGLGDAWAARDAAALERGKERARKNMAQLEAADKARAAAGPAPMAGVLPAPAQPNAAAGPSNAGAAAAAPAAAVPAVPAAAVAPPAPAANPLFPLGVASGPELAAMRAESKEIGVLASLFSSVHPAWKSYNSTWQLKYNLLMDRLGKLNAALRSGARVGPVDPAVLQVPTSHVDPPAGAVPAALQPLTKVYLDAVRNSFALLSGIDKQLKAAGPGAGAGVGAANYDHGGLGYAGALGYGANPYGDNVDALGGLFGVGAGYGARYGVPTEVGNPLFVQPGDLKDFFDIAAADFEDSEVVADAALSIGLKDHVNDKILGLNITLMPHQVVGVAWMRRKELEKTLKGGILADDMGLGKTVQALGVMVLRQADDDAPHRTSLIVCPFALIDQWKLEIQSKCTPGLLKIHVQHGKDKLTNVKQLQRFDVIITTYATLVQDFPDFKKHATARKKSKKAHKKMADFVEDDTDSDEWRSSLKKGPLAHMEFHRVILDEAQQIRNRNTRAAQACFEIKAEFRWALTGTPVTNGLEDLFSLFKFIGIRGLSDWKDFNDRIARKAKKKPDVAASRAQAILKGCLLRRNKSSQIDGKSILQLKEKHITEDLLEFSPEERKIYDVLQDRSRAKFNKFLKKGTVMKNYTQVLTLLLRLRQACNHPILLVRSKSEIRPDDVTIDDDDEAAAPAADADDDEDAGAGSSPEDAQELARATGACGAPWVEKQKKRLFDRALNTAIAELEGDDIDEEPYACAICFEDSRISEEAITACGHLFCRTCIEDVLQQNQQQAADDVDLGAKKPCPSCRTPYSRQMLFRAGVLEPTEAALEAELKKQGKVAAGAEDKDIAEPGAAGAVFNFGREDEDIKPFLAPKKAGAKGSASSSGAGAQSSSAKVKGKGKARILDSDDEDFVVKEEVEPWYKRDRISSDPRHKLHRRKLYESLGLEDDDVIEPSTKMQAMLQIVKTQMEQNPDDKFVIYSQWTTMLDLVADFLRREKVSHDLYDGRMNRKEREETISAFNLRKNPNVLLISLKCGGVGLNLVRANRVINLDLAWNSATEQQARDRVHRLGQQKEVYVNRLIIADTVEQRILDLQARKQGQSDAALGEGTGKKLKKLTVKDLQALFG